MPKQPHPDSPLVATVEAKLAPLGDIRARRMFSGFGLYLDGVVFGLILHGKLWLRVDDKSRPAFEKAGMPPFSYARKQTGRVIVAASYYRCPDAVLADGAKFRRWAKEARRASAERNTKKRAKKKKGV
jgi:DNA transformation protein